MLHDSCSRGSSQDHRHAVCLISKQCFLLQSTIPPDRTHPSAACQQEHGLRLCGHPTPRRTPSLGRFVACWDSFSLTLSHVGRLQAAGASQGIPGFAATSTRSLQSKVGKSGCDFPPAPTTLPFHTWQMGDVLTAARAARGAASQHRCPQRPSWE